MRAFGDLSSSARLQLVRDRFIARQMECSLRRHLDMVETNTPIRDIVDRCRVWESHAEDTDCWGARPPPNRPLPAYRIDDVRTESGPVCYSEDQDMLGSLMRHLLLTLAVSPPRVTPIPLEREQLIRRLMGKEHPVRLLLPEHSSFMDMEILLQSLLPVESQAMELPPPAVGRHGSTLVCFSSRVASRVIRLHDVPLWMIRFRSCLRDGKRTGQAMDLLCDRPRRRLTDIRRET